MEIETTRSSCLFEPLSTHNIFHVQSSQVLCQLDISFEKYNIHTCKLTLTKTHLYLTKLVEGDFPPGIDTCMGENSGVSEIKLDFDLKFQMLYSEHQNPISEKIGLVLFRNQSDRIFMYSNSSTQLQAMRKCLGRLINQRGFHSQFKPIKKLGKGNFASVYQVLSLQDGKKYAVKAFSKANTYNTQNGKQSLINQLSIMRQLSHCSDNILCLQAVYQSDNSIYIVLELLEGKNLFQIMKEKNQKGIGFNVEEIRVIMGGLLSGIKCMSQRGIMHRDMKAENIMFRYGNLSVPETYQPVIVDFGLAARSYVTPYLFYRCGTPGFVAPQIIKIQQNQQYSPACDMFSVGCIFHLLLTSLPVFTGIKYEQVYKKNKTLDFSIRKTEINNKNPYALALLQKMLDSQPITRINAVSSLADPFFVKGAVNKENQDCK